MRQILLYEYVTGGGLCGDASGEAPCGSLLAEGAAMIRALAADFAALPGIEVLALCDRRLADFDLPNCECASVGSASEEEAALRRLAARAEGTILIAPEWRGELARRARLVLEAGGRLLSPGPEFIELAADKHRTAEYLVARGVSTPRGVLLAPGESVPCDFEYPAVLKPVDGAGSQGVRLLESAAAVAEFAKIPEGWLAAEPRRRPSECRVTLGRRQGSAPSHPAQRLERYCPGIAASVAALAGPAGATILPACRQILSADGSFSYLGGRLPLSAELNERARRLAEASLVALPPTLGYVGFDLVLGENPAGTQDVVIEINPRLTTSYVGLRALCQGNLAAAWLKTADGGRPDLPFAAGPIEFRANGELAE